MQEDGFSGQASRPYLEQTPEGLTLIGKEGRLRGDFSSLITRITPRNLPGELPVKACKLKTEDPNRLPTLWDATAGLGEDSFLLAASGFSVTMYEYDETVAALLADALARSAAVPELAPVISRMRLLAEDSVNAMRKAKKEGV
ncbi:MAG: class I SAM-dependent methyltransferase, partial [Clostridia bacterium]|nr:class I SAM-dependent methyltransferase [Clostridia bacterium]